MDINLLKEESNQEVLLRTGIGTYEKALFMWRIRKGIEIKILNTGQLLYVPECHFNKIIKL